MNTCAQQLPACCSKPCMLGHLPGSLPPACTAAAPFASESQVLDHLRAIVLVRSSQPV